MSRLLYRFIPPIHSRSAGFGRIIEISLWHTEGVGEGEGLFSVVFLIGLVCFIGLFHQSTVGRRSRFGHSIEISLSHTEGVREGVLFSVVFLICLVSFIGLFH